MAHGPTRAQLTGRISELQRMNAAITGEADMLRKELHYAKESEQNTRKAMRTVEDDRERLTATIEVLARRLATDDPCTLNRETPINQATDPYAGKSYRGR